MIVQNIELRDWDWSVLVFYDTKERDADSILLYLEMSGCAGRSLRRAERNLRSGLKDTGLTYTNPTLRETVVVIGSTNSPEQFWNTLDHEKGHVVMHIAGAIGLDHESEEYQYLSGALGQEMYPAARMFICERCNR